MIRTVGAFLGLWLLGAVVVMTLVALWSWYGPVLLLAIPLLILAAV